MPRKRSEVTKVHWKITIPSPLSARVEILIFDPVTKKPAYGKRAVLVERLLSEFMRKVDNGDIDPDEWTD